MFKRRKANENKLFAIELEYKCPLKWKDMEGDDQVRHCSSCKKNVYNLSTMTRQEAVDFINRTEGRECVTFFQRKDGKVVTRDCLSELGIKNIRWQFNILAVLNAALACAGTILAPMLGPACVTIVGGIGPTIKSESADDTTNSTTLDYEAEILPTPEELGLEMDLVNEEGRLKQ